MKPTTFNVLNVIGTWLTGVGTVSAVVLSLYLARRDTRIRLRVNAGHRVIVRPGADELPDYCSITIVNHGFRRARVTNIGWKSGFIKKRYSIQQIDGNVFSSPLPIELDYGQEATYLIPFRNQDGAHHWIDEFPKAVLPKWPFLNVWSLKLRVFTSVGKTFEARPEKGLRDRVVESAKRHLTTASSRRGEPRG